MSRALQAATRVRPPSEANRTSTAVTAATASAAIATGATKEDHWFSCICTSAFNINFSDDGTSTLTNPATTYFFAANTVYDFVLFGKNTHFKVTAQATGTFLHWKSSRNQVV